MNRYDPLGEEAVIDFGSPDFTIVKPGRFVRCAVTGAAIPLASLAYWDADLNEAYIDAPAALARWKQRNSR